MVRAHFYKSYSLTFISTKLKKFYYIMQSPSYIIFRHVINTQTKQTLRRHYFWSWNHRILGIPENKAKFISLFFVKMKEKLMFNQIHSDSSQIYRNTVKRSHHLRVLIN